MAWQIILTVALLITSAVLFFVTNKLKKANKPALTDEEAHFSPKKPHFHHF